MLFSFPNGSNRFEALAQAVRQASAVTRHFQSEQVDQKSANYILGRSALFCQIAILFC